ncbi:hypothetical protein N7454_008292 [Penicillium verhagenii]|nr:hypothetical protein N7454_008292 [Penicillium verhagenii]
MASVENQFVNASTEQEWLDFDQFLDLSPSYSDDYSANSISPEMSLPYEGEMFANNLPDLTQSGFPDMATYDLSHDLFFADQSPDMGLMPDFVPSCDDAMFTGCQSYDTTYDFRQVVEAQAAVDPRVASLKEKRREAAIALHLQRLCDATALDLEMSSDSNTSFSSPCWSDYMRESISPQSNSSSPEQTSAPPPSGNGGMEMVLDLNMNATANLPKKQKPRSQAQKENYIKARKYGACEKHKKQHKRCNCLEKAAARAGASEVPMDVAFKERPTLQLSPSRTVRSQQTVQSQHSFNASDHDPSRVVQVVRPPVDMTKKIMVKSPVNEPSISPTGVQPFTTSTTKFNRKKSGHDPLYSTSFVLSPVLDTSQKQRSSNSSPGDTVLPPSSRLQTSIMASTSPQSARKTVVSPSSRPQTSIMASTLSQSARKTVVPLSSRLQTSIMASTLPQTNRKTVVVPKDLLQSFTASQNARQIISTTSKPEIGTPGHPGTQVRRPRNTHVRHVASCSQKATNQAWPDQPAAGISPNCGLCVHRPRTAILSSTAKTRSFPLVRRGNTEQTTASLFVKSSAPQSASSSGLVHYGDAQPSLAIPRSQSPVELQSARPQRSVEDDGQTSISQPSAIPRSRLPVELQSAWPQRSAEDEGQTSISKSNGVLRHIIQTFSHTVNSQLGLSSSLPLRQSTSLTLWTDRVFLKGLSTVGSCLASAKKSIGLSHMRSFWFS